MFGSAAVYIIPGTVKGLPRRCAAPRDETRMDDVAFYLKIYPLSPRRARIGYRSRPAFILDDRVLKACSSQSVFPCRWVTRHSSQTMEARAVTAQVTSLVTHSNSTQRL